MSHEFEQIPRVTLLAAGNVGDELTFAYPDVLEIIEACSANEIAVLGVEMFFVKPDGHYASGCSTYDLLEKQRWPAVQLPDWLEYVKFNNACGIEFVRQNPLGDDHVYILTTASWREYLEIETRKRQMPSHG